MTSDPKHPLVPRSIGHVWRGEHSIRSGLALVCIAALLNLLVLDPIVAATAAGTASAASPAVSYTYDASGRLATVTTSAGTATYNYDAEGNLLAITRSAAAAKQRVAGSRRSGAPTPAVTSTRVSAVASGHTIILHGRGFSSTARVDVVHIGDLQARVTRASSTRLEVTAPPGTGGIVRVSTPGGTVGGPRVTVTEPPSSTQPPAGRDLHPLRASAGVTAVSGLVEDNHGTPLPGVGIRVLSSSGTAQAGTTTSSSGQFLLANLTPGTHQLVISADNLPGTGRYGVYTEPIELPRGHTTVMPWVTYLTPLDLTHAVTLSSPATREITVTTPKIPGLQIEIPQGTVIRDHDGRIVRKVSITPLTVGRTPYPLAPGMQPNFFTLQPGDATVSGAGLRVIYPNGTDQPPGTAIPYFIDTPDWPGTGWWRYGTGHVSANGKLLVPEPGVRWHKISLGGYGTAPPPPGGGRAAAAAVAAAAPAPATVVVAAVAAAVGTATPALRPAARTPARATRSASPPACTSARAPT